MTSLDKLSYDISCDHIKKLNEKYNSLNDRFFKDNMVCYNNHDDDYSKNKKDIRYLNNIYVSRKSCIYKTTEPDELLWTSSFNPTNPTNMTYIDNNINVIFNENTRKKILTKY